MLIEFSKSEGVQKEGEETVIDSKNQTRDSHTKSKRSCHSDFYVIGTLWLRGLKSALLGAQLCIIPVVEAYTPPPPPTKPPPMKYKDLPLYKSPHYEYKDYIENKDRCPEADVKLLHRFLLPYVKICRKELQDKTCQAICATRKTLDSISKSVNCKKEEFKQMMRDPQNIAIRKATVVIGAATGYLLVSGKGLPRRIFMTAAGAVAAGALCFPKETDEAVRDFAFYTGKTVIGCYNWTCGKQFTWRERLPCKENLPADKKEIVRQCPEKK